MSLRDLGLREGQRVGGTDMAVDVEQEDRAGRGDGIEFGHREIAALQQVVVDMSKAIHWPGAVFAAAAFIAATASALVVEAAVPDVVQQRTEQAGQDRVIVRVDEARQQRAALEINDSRRRARQAGMSLGGLPAARILPPPIASASTCAPGGGHRIDRAVAEDHLGGVVGAGRGGLPATRAKEAA